MYLSFYLSKQTEGYYSKIVDKVYHKDIDSAELSYSFILHYNLMHLFVLLKLEFLESLELFSRQSMLKILWNEVLDSEWNILVQVIVSCI